MMISFEATHLSNCDRAGVEKTYSIRSNRGTGFFSEVLWIHNQIYSPDPYVFPTLEQFEKDNPKLVSDKINVLDGTYERKSVEDVLPYTGRMSTCLEVEILCRPPMTVGIIFLGNGDDVSYSLIINETELERFKRYSCCNVIIKEISQ